MANKRTLLDEQITSVNRLGLTVLVDPIDANIDIVFVHGFTGHPERTWTHKGRVDQNGTEDGSSNGRPSKFRKLISSTEQPARKSVYWPRDLLPSVMPEARILTFGYDTDVRHAFAGPISTVYDIAWDLLLALDALHRDDNARRIVFIAHSLGGIVVKETLRRSMVCHLQDHHRNLGQIQSATCGIMFFGTPHSGADPRNIAHHAIEKLVKLSGARVNAQIVETLLPSSERLRELRDEFGPMVRQRGWIVYSFQEQYGLAALNGEKVVDDTSSQLNIMDIEIPQHIASDHREMCRFYGAHDPEFGKVISAFRRISAETTRTQHASTSPSSISVTPVLTSEQRLRIMDSLQFDQLESRQASIKVAHAKTCKWLLQKSEYKDWIDRTKLSSNHGFFWIKGNPATGKSTIMKFLHAHTIRTMKLSCIISFFFNARGESLERTTLGMYRSLLYQLLSSQTHHQSIFAELPSSLLKENLPIVWEIEILKTLFQKALQLVQGTDVVIYIDALDECPEDEVRDMVGFLETVVQDAATLSTRKLICFSSRHYPHIVVERGIELTLEGQEGHRRDIANYLESELRAGKSTMVENIKVEILERAHGIFLWVVLVVKLLNKAYAHGQMSALRKRLDEIPDQLEQLFVDILRRDSENVPQLVLCLRWILCAKTPLKREELYFAILSGDIIESPCPWNRDEVTEDDMTRFILSCSKGLADVTKSKKQTVQFIHESVREFLKDGGLSHLDSELGFNFVAKSHDILKSCCLAYLMANHPADGFSRSRATAMHKDKIRQQVKHDFPFLEYAICNVLYHADVAQDLCIPQNNFLEDFPLDIWIYENNRIHRLFERHVPDPSSRLEICYGHELMALTRLEVEYQSRAHLPVENIDRFLYVTAAIRHKSVFQSLVVPEACTCEITKSCTCLFLDANFERSWKLIIAQQMTKKFKNSSMMYLAISIGDSHILESLHCVIGVPVESGMLVDAVKSGDAEILRYFWESDHMLKRFTADFWKDLLRSAIQEGYSQSVAYLLTAEQKEGVLAREDFQNLCDFGFVFGDHQIIKLLASHGDKRFGGEDEVLFLHSSLLLAAKEGQLEKVRSLLHHPLVDVNCKEWNRSPLFYALKQGHLQIIRELLQQPGIDISSDGRIWRQLILASHAQREGLALLLCDARAVVDQDALHNYLGIFEHDTLLLLINHHTCLINRLGHSDETILMKAVHYGFDAIAKIILTHPDVDINMRNIAGDTALTIAEREGYTGVAALLRNDPRIIL